MEIHIISDFLSDEECDKYLKYIKKEMDFGRQRIVKDARLANELYERHKDKFQKLPIVCNGLYEDVTLSMRTSPIKKHIDRKVNDCKYKVLIYLNWLSEGGGTIFYQDGRQIKVENKKGSCVIFDIGLEHSGENSPDGEIKYTIGFRIKGNELQNESDIKYDNEYP